MQNSVRHDLYHRQHPRRTVKSVRYLLTRVECLQDGAESRDRDEEQTDVDGPYFPESVAGNLVDEVSVVTAVQVVLVEFIEDIRAVDEEKDRRVWENCDRLNSER